MPTPFDARAWMDAWRAAQAYGTAAKGLPWASMLGGGTVGIPPAPPPPPPVSGLPALRGAVGLVPQAQGGSLVPRVGGAMQRGAGAFRAMQQAAAQAAPQLRATLGPVVDVLDTALLGPGAAPAAKASSWLKPAAKLAGKAAGPIGALMTAKGAYDAYQSMDPDPWYLDPARTAEPIDPRLDPSVAPPAPPVAAPRPREGGRRAPSVPSRSELGAGAKRPFLEQNVVVDDEGRSSEEMSWTPERGDTISGLARSLLGAEARPADVKALSDKIVRLLGGDRVYAGRTYDLSGLDAPTGPAPAPTGIPMSVPLPELALPPMGRPPPLEQHRRMLGEPPPANLTRDVIDRRHRFAPGRAEELVSGLHSRGGRGPAR